MSLFGSLFSGVSALNAQSQAMGIISDNIANLNTTGFKATTARFETLVTTAATETTFSPGGVRTRPVALVDHQGLVQASASPTDLAISGQGFFVVNSSADLSGSVLYTRAGSFHQDNLGNLVNTAGFYLQGWRLDPDGRIPGEPGNLTNTTSSADLASLETINVGSINGAAAATTSVSMGANLGASQSVLLGPQDTTRPSLKVKLDHFEKGRNISGLRNLTFNNNRQDRSLMSQFMGYQIWDDAGAPGSRCAFAKLTVNGRNLGVYCHVETVREPLLKREFGNDKGTLFEGTVVDFYPESQARKR